MMHTATSAEQIRPLHHRPQADRRRNGGDNGHDVVVIVSAVAGKINRLLTLAKEVNEDMPPELRA